MQRLPIRPALVCLFSLCAMVAVGLLACGAADDAAGPQTLSRQDATASSAEATVSAALRPTDATAH